MKKIEAVTLEEAYKKASLALDCSISELQCEVVQYPSKGIFGFLKKSAIIVATCTQSTKSIDKKVEEKYVADEIIATVKEEIATEEVVTKKESVAKKETVIKKERVSKKEITTEEVAAVEEIAPEEKVVEKDTVIDNFFNVESVDDAVSDDIASVEVSSDDENLEVEEEAIVYDELALMIENQLKDLLSQSCFEIDVVEVDVIDNTALIFIDGDDAALLIGKEGYRYNALSYILFNWLHTKYELFIKLEIAEFLTTQQEMIKSYIKPVIEQAEATGRAKTRFLDGILVQIALEQLRERFPNKYVAVKTSRDGKKFVVINEFNTKINA